MLLVDLNFGCLCSVPGAIVPVNHFTSDELGLVGEVYWLVFVFAVEHFFVIDDAGGLLIHLRKVSF